jgi:hypothetical protein
MRVAAGLVIACAVLLPVAAGRGAAPAPFEHTYASPAAMAEALLEAWARRDVPALRAMALTPDEFQAHVWPRLPVSRPDRGMPLDYVWQDLDAKSRASLQQALRRPLPPHAGLARVAFDGETTSYGTFLVHRKSRLVLRDRAGAETSVRLFGSLLEVDGRYKIFSYVVD